MAQFRDYLESEGVDTQESVELPLFIQPNEDFLNRGLVIPRLDEGKRFTDQETVLLQYEAELGPVSIAMSPTVQQIESGTYGIANTSAKTGIKREIPPESLNFVDWNRAYSRLLEYKETKGLSNLLVRPGLLRPILEAGRKAYLLESDESVVKLKSHEDQQRLQEAITAILCKYADMLYRRRQASWESDNLTYRQLDRTDANFRFNFSDDGNAGQYIVKLPRENSDLAQEVEKLITDCNTFYRGEQETLPRIHFDRHLYQPLLVETEGVTSSPPGSTAQRTQIRR